MTNKSETDNALVFAAIAKSVGEIKVLGKDGKNSFQKYDFASIDKFLALVNPICAANGLFPLINLAEFELYENVDGNKKSTWGRFWFEITLCHSSAQTFGPVKYMVSVPMNGAQASGSAQSYALKQFFRALFMIPTGDKDDADLIPTQPHSMPDKTDKQPKPLTINDEQYSELFDLVEISGLKHASICKWAGCETLRDIPSDKFDAAKKKINLKLSKIEADERADLEKNEEIPY